MVLVDFWTYSCINCQRSLPHVEAWYNDYKKDGFVVVGVSTPEFAFEHVVSNVRSAAGSLGVHYPMAIDNNYGTWDAYNNEYWPAEYLIDPTGQVRAYDFGEGGYSTMESNIRALLTANGVTDLPPRTDVANKTPTARPPRRATWATAKSSTPSGRRSCTTRPIDYHAPDHRPAQQLRVQRDVDRPQPGGDGRGRRPDRAALRRPTTSTSSWAGPGTVDVSFNGEPSHHASVDGVPRLYTLFSGERAANRRAGPELLAGVQAYDFTFG